MTRKRKIAIILVALATLALFGSLAAGLFYMLSNDCDATEVKSGARTSYRIDCRS